MKASHLIFKFLLLSSLAVTSVQAQQTFRTTKTSVIGYLEYLPSDYATNSSKYPVVFFLHGLGERGVNSKDPATLQTTINAVAKNGPPKLVNSGTKFPFILISPQLKDNYGDWPVNYVMEVINYCKTYLRIDESQIYLTGLSLGGGGTWSVAQDYSSLFAAIAPVCGSRNDHAKACNIAGENLPVWAFHGDADTTVPSMRTKAMITAINACLPAPTPLAQVTIYPGINHNCWDLAYSADHSVQSPLNVYEWMLSYRNTINAGNFRPVANAGIDMTVSVTDNNIPVVGTVVDAEGSIASYSWSQLSGPSTATLASTTSSTLLISNLALGDYVFQFKVTDAAGNTDTDYIKVTASALVNKAPVAAAGSDMSVVLPTNTVTINGTGTDADGTVTAYQWTKVSGDTAVMTGTSSATLAASSLIAGNYVFRLTVTDNNGAKSSDDVAVVVNATANIAPVSNAGPDKTILLPTNSGTLFGSATDADGTIASYRWTQLSGGACTLSSTTIARPKISDLTTGSFSFRLTVTDNAGATSYDDMVVIVDYAPTVDAGADAQVTLPATSINLTGMAADQDGTVASYVWSKSSGPAATLLNKNTPTVTATKLVEGTYVFKLVVTDDAGVQSSDVVTVVVSAATAAARTATTTTTTTAETKDVTVKQDTNFSLPTLDTQAYVKVYDANGAQLFAGTWSPDNYNEVFSKPGMYVYQIIDNGNKTAGKVVIVGN